jgi:hypothetical protein
MSELQTVLEERKKQRNEVLVERKKQRNEVLGEIIKEFEAIKEQQDNVDDIETKDFKSEFDINFEHFKEKLRHYKKKCRNF